MKTELLVQMDGLAKTDDLVFLLAASNLPWYVYLNLQQEVVCRIATKHVIAGPEALVGHTLIVCLVRPSLASNQIF